jgi:hypothetical protein
MKVKLMGGLGNQMFQYAFGLSLSKAIGAYLLFDRSYFDVAPQHQYSLDGFGLRLNFDLRDVRPSRSTVYVEQGLPYDPRTLSAPANTSFIGYWQTERYFDVDAVRKAFGTVVGNPVAATSAMEKVIGNEPNSTFIHVRRGDYLQPGTRDVHGCQPMDYYTVGMDRILSTHPDAKFFVFSDDPQWCKSAFNTHNCLVVDIQQENFWDMWLMSRCKHAIIANSSFSWWGAWLGSGENRIVIAPARWFLSTALDSRDIVPDRWIKL